MGYLYRYLTLLLIVPIISWNIPYYHIENVHSVKYKSSIFAVQGTELHNLVHLHATYSFITNSLLGLKSLAKSVRL